MRSLPEPIFFLFNLILPISLVFFTCVPPQGTFQPLHSHQRLFGSVESGYIFISLSWLNYSFAMDSTSGSIGDMASGYS
jgi:hypothetical protein